MIIKQEIMELAKAKNVAPGIIEKDYVLGWVLAGINYHKELSGKWIFKGGTSLKKCFFQNYRFSEDLDFTILDQSHLDKSFLQNSFLEVLNWVYDQSGIDFAYEQTKFDIHPDTAKQYVTGSIYYTGPMRQRGSLNKIYLDILGNELLVSEACKMDILHDYSDRANVELFAYCYSLEEIFAEKVRALAERARPRDLYDVVYLYREKRNSIHKQNFIDILTRKCLFKSISVPNLTSFNNHSKFQELHAEWNNMLKHQVAVLPDIEIFLKEIILFFDWLEI